MFQPNLYLFIGICIIFILYLIKKLLNYKQLKKENDDLKKENADLIQQNIKCKICKKENTELQLKNIELETLKKYGYIYVGKVLITINNKIISFIKIGYSYKDTFEDFEDRIVIYW